MSGNDFFPFPSIFPSPTYENYGLPDPLELLPNSKVSDGTEDSLINNPLDKEMLKDYHTAAVVERAETHRLCLTASPSPLESSLSPEHREQN